MAGAAQPTPAQGATTRPALLALRRRPRRLMEGTRRFLGGEEAVHCRGLRLSRPGYPVGCGDPENNSSFGEAPASPYQVRSLTIANRLRAQAASG